MAASGLAELAEAAALEMAMDRKTPRVRLLQLNTIFSGTFDKNTTCSGTDLAKCLERLNGVLPAAAIEPYLKTSLAQNLNGFNFGRQTFSSRLGRSPSTDSIAASNFSSDQGSVDSCNYSSNGSDSNSGSSPCSPEEPDRYSRSGTPQPMPPIPPSLQDDSRNEEEEEEDCYPPSKRPKTSVFNNKNNNVSRTSVRLRDDNERISSLQEEQSDSSETLFKSGSVSNSENIKHFYLQSSCSVPNSNSISSSSSSFQRADAENSVSNTCEGSSSCSTVSDKIGSFSESSSHSSSQQPSYTKQTSVQVNSSSNSQSNCSSNELQRCNWQQCKLSLEGNAELVEHIRSQHVQLQKDKETFVCLWEGCKVYNRASCSLSWLERHVLSHGGNKPFKCIVDNCSQRFPSQAALQRHVNSHFENNSQGGKANKCRDDTFPKSFRRKKHLKYKKRSSHGRTEDFFDANIMEQIRYKLVEIHSCTDGSNIPRCITFHSRVKARRTEKGGKVNVLLEWIPENILPECWVSQDSIIKYKTVPISSLPSESLAFLGLFSKDPSDTPRVKQRRK